MLVTHLTCLHQVDKPSALNALGKMLCTVSQPRAADAARGGWVCLSFSSNTSIDRIFENSCVSGTHYLV
jgi:hypothetical protein